MAALPDTRMPGVFTVEVPTIPPSIGVVPSAVPCFIGYTEFASKNGEDVLLKPVRIRNLREYENYFGTAPAQAISVDLLEIVDDLQTATSIRTDVRVQPADDFKFKMYYAMKLYYANGGGPGYIISVGNYEDDTVAAADLQKGVDAARLAKDVTILSFPDAGKNLNDDDHYGTLIPYTLKHCMKMVNRIVVVDVDDKNTDISYIGDNFRTKIPKDISLKYGGAYYPFLQTTIDYRFDPAGVTIASHHAFTSALLLKQQAITQLSVQAKGYSEAKDVAAASTAADLGALRKEVEDALRKKALPVPAEVTAALKKPGATLDTAKADIKKAFDDFDTAKNTRTGEFEAAQKEIDDQLPAGRLLPAGSKMGDLESSNNLMFNKIREAINAVPVILPPSPAIAGLMVQTDATQGVWKAPANVGLAAVIAPTVEIDDDFHADLNVDAGSGKSVNAIRTYEGKGILVFGARTLTGNDLEWRYISVRRTFNFIEDSVARAMQDFVFAPNTRDSWIKVKAMISNFLIEIWKSGGLFGNTMNEAFQVNVGLPETMTDVDILEGRMIVEIKLRVARPAEFIILRYEHKFQANAA
ncbi:phage tail sheath family protein [Dyadobacter sandarakinus]|uniref:Phage tail sheath family protein n=1 Tax=Dyadobacter sandarakinus TaxID=2747268 RepID=A0ABX7I419_9BACT|nr:phage tail sheath family protein [Dyadobacter sandarakinus]QRR00615.1 phage tail sheath family protein [Dyadobacter sandarakinus]